MRRTLAFLLLTPLFGACDATTPETASHPAATSPGGSAGSAPVGTPSSAETRVGGPKTLVPDAPMVCGSCEEWNAPRPPFEVFANTYFVGTLGLSSVLITTEQGHVLIDVALPQSAPAIASSIESLGFNPADIKFILTSHAHFDHVGGVRSMQRYTGATVLASASTAEALALGHPVPADPQFGTGPTDVFPALTEGVRVMKDGEAIQLGGTTVTARYTPGHTPGATSWTWRSCEGDRCLNMVYADSLTAVSRDGYRFSDDKGSPNIVDIFRATFNKVASFPCDIILSTHPVSTGMDDKLAARVKDNVAPGAARDPFVNPQSCASLADVSRQNLDERLQTEAKPNH